MKQKAPPTSATPHHRHLVALPYPGRGHIKPMLNLCYLILSSQPDFLISFVVTEEWLGFLTAELHPRPLPNLRLVAIPQVIPSEIGRAANSPGFYEAVNTKLENPFEQLLDRLQPPATAIIYDTFITWVVGLGSKRKIPVASLFTQSASVFTVYYHLDLLVQHGHLPLDLDASVKPMFERLKVLRHPSIRGFWTHCGWNSNWEAIYAGVPMLTCPIAGDQFSNSKLIVSDWKIGIRAVNNDHKGTLVTRHEIAQTVKQFMDSQDDGQKEMVNRAKSLQEICRQAIADGGSAASCLVDFIRDIC